jgi:hypothetical protein
MTFNIQDDDNKIKVSRLTKRDSDFFIDVNETLYPRAAIEISNDAPADIQLVLANAYESGWIVPVAWVCEDQLMWDRIRKKT